MEKFDVNLESESSYKCGEIYIVDEIYWYNCLYCKHNLKTITAFKKHILDKHKCDLDKINTETNNSQNNNQSAEYLDNEVNGSDSEQLQTQLQHEHFTRKSFLKKLIKIEPIDSESLNDDHDKITEFKCKLCTDKFTTKYKLDKHRIVCPNKILDSDNCTCTVCGKEFIRPLLARQHERRCTISLNAEWVKCKICCKRMFKETLKSHYEKLHPECLLDDSDKIKELIEKSTEYSCMFCKKIFTNISDTRLHEESCETSSSLNWIKCRKCGVYMFKSKLSEHMSIRHGENDTSIGVSKKIILNTEPESALSCKVCGKNFAYRRLVMQHERRCQTSYNAEWTKCMICGKRMFKHTLQNHIEKLHPNSACRTVEMSGNEQSCDEIEFEETKLFNKTDESAMNEDDETNRKKFGAYKPSCSRSRSDSNSSSDTVHMEIVDEHGNIISKDPSVDDLLDEPEIDYIDNDSENKVKDLKIEILYDQAAAEKGNSDATILKKSDKQNDGKKMNSRRKLCNLCNRVMGDIYEHRKICGKKRQWTICRICGYHMFEEHVEGHMQRHHANAIQEPQKDEGVATECKEEDEEQDKEGDETKEIDPDEDIGEEEEEDDESVKSDNKVYNDNTEDTADNADIDETMYESSSADEAYADIFLSDDENGGNKTDEHAEMQVDENGDANIVASKKAKKRKPCDLCGRYFVNVSEHQLNSCSQPKNRVTCTVCGAHVFQRNFQRHMDLHNHSDSPELLKKSRRNCQYCHKDFVSRWGSVERHEKYCSSIVNREKCKYCKYYISKINMDKHLKNKHFDKDGNLSNIATKNFENFSEQDLQKLPCRYCNELFLRPFMHEKRCVARNDKEWCRCQICAVLVLKSRMNIHIKKRHQIEIDDEDDLKDGDDSSDVQKSDYVKCNLCGSHILEKNFEYHILRRHKEKIPLNENEILDYNMLKKLDLKQYQSPTNLGEWVKCKFCGINVSEPSLQSHLDLHKKFGKARGPNFQCSVCKIKLNARAMDKHLRTKHLNDSNSTVCKLCENDKRIHNAYYDNHLKWHSGELQSFDCKICDRKYEFKYNLDRHMVAHEEEPACTCDICGKQFQNNYRLTHHKQIHSTDAKFQCDTCGKSFILKARLQSHQLSHLDRKFFRFPCTVCHKRFNAKAKLNDHMITHTRTKDYSCSICQAKFARKFDAIKHQRRHTEIGHLMCSICEKRFFLKRPLRDHLKSSHGVVDEGAIVDTRIQVLQEEIVDDGDDDIDNAEDEDEIGDDNNGDDENNDDDDDHDGKNDGSGEGENEEDGNEHDEEHLDNDADDQEHQPDDGENAAVNCPETEEEVSDTVLHCLAEEEEEEEEECLVNDEEEHSLAEIDHEYEVLMEMEIFT